MTHSSPLLIEIDDLPARVHVGVPDTERASAQTVLVSLRLALEAPAPFTRKSPLSATVDYAPLLDFIGRGLQEEPPTALIETIAERVIDAAFAHAPQAVWVEARVKKPSVAPAPAMVSVTLRRSRPQ